MLPAEILKNPAAPNALTLADVLPNVEFMTFVARAGLVRRGVFESVPDYISEKSRWTARAKIGQKTVEVLLYDAGVSPDSSGQGWAEAVTVRDDYLQTDII